MLNLSSLLDFSTEENPEKTAVICDRKRITFTQLRNAANRIANGLARLGIGKGDNVAMNCPNHPCFPMVYFGILKTGAAVVPINNLLKRKEIAHCLKDSQAKLFFCYQGTQDLPMGAEGFAGFEAVDNCDSFYLITNDARSAVPVPGTNTLEAFMARESDVFDTVPTSTEDTAVILYTSGTTGAPKGAELSHTNMVMNAFVNCDLTQTEHGDITAIALPLFHALGQSCQMNAAFVKGNTIVLIPRFTPQAVLSAVQDEGATIFTGVPTMWWHLLNYTDEEGRFDVEKIAATLKIGTSGGASLPKEVINGIEEKYRIPILEDYGLSEVSPTATFNHFHKRRKPGSVGTPIWGTEVKIFDVNGKELPTGEVGEVVIRGHNVMKGYFNNAPATRAAFKGTSWFHTGDLGKMDEDGYLYIVDRVKDLIVRGGYNVYPREIEEVLMGHPSVSLAAVTGIPHDRHGEEIKAFIVPTSDGNITEEEIIAWSKEQMANYKYPRKVDIRETLPMTATGKILKKELNK